MRAPLQLSANFNAVRMGGGLEIDKQKPPTTTCNRTNGICTHKHTTRATNIKISSSSNKQSHLWTMYLYYYFAAILYFIAVKRNCIFVQNIDLMKSISYLYFSSPSQYLSPSLALFRLMNFHSNKYFNKLAFWLLQVGNFPHNMEFQSINRCAAFCCCCCLSFFSC